MSKEPAKPTLEAACEALAAAEADYQKLIAGSKLKRTVAEAAAHQAACRKALAEKRYAMAAVEALRRNLPVPKKEDLIECQP